MKALIIIFNLLLLSGCVGMGNAAQRDKLVLDSKDYKIASVEVDGDKIRVPDGASLSIDGDKIFGNAGCNSYFASFVMGMDSITVQTVGSTRMYCADHDKNVFESLYLRELNGGFVVSGNDDILILESNKMKIVLEKK